MKNEPLDGPTAAALAKRALAAGAVAFSAHALQSMKQRGITTTDCASVLRGGWVGTSEEVLGSWRYQFLTAKICLIVAFRSETEIVVITAWRLP